MKTKSGKSHFASEFRTYNSSGVLCYENKNFRFTAFSAKDYIERSVKRYANMGMTAEFKNIVNLDEDSK